MAIQMDVAIAVICDYANTSADGKLNILGVFQQINAPVLPFQVPQMYVVVSTVAAPTEQGQEFPFELLFWGEDGNEILRLQQRLQFPVATYPGERVINNQIVGMAGLPLQAAGDYSFIVRISGEERRTITLRVNDRSRDATDAANTE